MPSIYSNAFVFLNGALQQENTTVEVGLEHETQDYFSIESGYEGTDLGPSIRTIQWEVVIPIGGNQTNYEKLMAEKATVEMRVEEAGAGGRVILSRGRIVGVSERAGVGQTMAQSIMFRGTGKPAG